MWLPGVAVLSATIYAMLLRASAWKMAIERDGWNVSLLLMTYVTQLLTVSLAYGIGWLVGLLFR